MSYFKTQLIVKLQPGLQKDSTPKPSILSLTTEYNLIFVRIKLGDSQS